MSTFTITGVRKETSSDGTHKHIEGVCTTAGVHYTRKQVVDSIKSGNVWKTSANGFSATVETMTYCPKSSCLASPYIKTKPDSTKKDNLENLDAC
jgi:hypothetical protein